MTQEPGTPNAVAPAPLPDTRHYTKSLGRDIAAVLRESRALWIAWDTAAACVSIVAAFMLSPAFARAVNPENPLYVVPAYALSFVIAAFAAGLYERAAYRSPIAASTAAVISVGIAWIVVLSGFYLFRFAAVGRWVFAISACSTVVLTSVPRAVMALVGKRPKASTLLVSDESGSKAVRSAAGKDVDHLHFFDYTQLGPDDFVRHIYEVHPSLLVVQSGCPKEFLERATDLLSRGLPVTDLVGYYETEYQKVPAELVDLNWLIAGKVTQTRPLASLGKRLADLSLAGVGLLLTMPLWPLLAIAIKLTSRGPIFYSQVRVGKRGKLFRIIKFRTMREDAETSGAVWAIQNDPRVTAIGRLMRRTRLDEIPQFLNVLVGDMSFVGPRPERPEFESDLARNLPLYHLRHLVKPGITGLAQIRYMYGSSEDDALEKLRYELYYVKHAGFSLDLAIILRTFGALMKGSR